MVANRFIWRALGSAMLGGMGIVAAWSSPTSASTVATQLTPGIPEQPTSVGAVFFDRTVPFAYTSGRVLLAGSADGTAGQYVDDVLRLTVTRPDGSTASYVHDYSHGCQGFISVDPPEDVTGLFRPGTNSVQVVLQDQCGVVVGSSEHYLVAVNEGPTATPQSVTVDEDSQVGIVLTGTDPEGDALAFTVVSGPAHGTVTGTPPNVVYTPVHDYFGPDAFVFQVDDGHQNTSTATVSITVRPVQDPPVAADDQATTPEDTPLVIPAATLLSNDSDVDGDVLSVTGVTAGQGTHGTVSFANGQVTYTPAPDYFGPASFQYRITDGQATATATVYVTVTPVNDPPVCSAVSASETALWPPDHGLRMVSLSGATDVEGDPVIITVTAVTQDEPVNGLGDGDTGPDAVAGATSNEVQLRAERSGTGDGRVYRVSFTASDGQGGTCSGVVRVSVPKSQGGAGSTAVESPLVVDSFGS